MKPSIYDAGGVLPPGLHVVRNDTGRDEAVRALPEPSRWRFWGRVRPDRVEHFPIRDEAPATKNGDAGTVTMRLYEPIDSWGGPFGVSASEFVSALDEVDDSTTEIRLHINSPGGEVFEGIAILNALRSHPAKFVAVVDGLAASAASFIAAGADEVIVGKNAELMIHDASGIAIGDAKVMRDLADRLDHLSNNIASIYAGKAGGTVADWRGAMLAETWYSAQEAVDAGLADEVADSGTSQPSDRFDLSIFNHAGRSDAPAPKIPSVAPAAKVTPPGASAAGDHSQEGDAAVDFTDEQLTTLRQSVGVGEDADAGTILAALTEALEERADDGTAAQTEPEGVVRLDQATYDELVNNARAGREARDEQHRDRRERLVDEAVRDGRIPPARREAWLAQLAADAGASEVLASLAKGTIPVGEPYGHDQQETNEDDATYFALFPDEKKGA